MKYFAVLLIGFFTCFSASKIDNKKQILPAHAHNDYEHDNPLFDALSYGFKSIEADVYLIDDSLFVAHNPDEIRHGRTLRKLYLEPLKKIVSENNGSVYGNGEEIILLIDIKDDGLKTYKLLHQILGEYKSIMTSFVNGKKVKGSVLAVISGNRPFEYMKEQKVRYAGYDGRLKDIDSGIIPTLMPMVSNSWGEYFSWDGTGGISSAEKEKLNNWANKAREKGYLLRFWGTPNRTDEQKKNVWKVLKDAGVGLIGADDLEELQHFLLMEE